MSDHTPQMPKVQSVAWTGPLWIAAYVALDYISFVDAYRGLAITPWNPASGLALALALLGGVRYAPVILVAPAVAGALVRGSSVPAEIHVVEGLLIGGSYLAAGLIARAYGAIDLRLPTARDVLALMFTALCAAAAAALSYVAVLHGAGLLDRSEITEGFVRFVVGDLIGTLIVTPAVLLAVMPATLAATRRLWPAMAWEAPLQLITIALGFAAIFAIPHASEYQLFYLLFVPLLWSTFRAGIAGAVAALCVIQIGLILALHLRHGAMSELTSFQILMISLAATGLVFGSLVGQQQASALRLRHQQLALSRALRLRSMGEIATVIAHEINQPITSIRTYAGITKDALDARRSDRAIEAVAKIRSECDRASAIVRATRDIVRQQVARPQPIHTEPMLAEVRELLLDRLAGIVLTVRVSPQAGAVVGDPVQIKQALYNIIDNSIDAIEGRGAAGAITVSVEARGRAGIAFVVRDSGPGFSPDLLDFGTTPLISTKSDGTGIGLSIARSVAEAHGGSLSIGRDGNDTVVTLLIESVEPLAALK